MVIDKDNSAIVDGAGDAGRSKVASIRFSLKSVQPAITIEKSSGRLAKLVGGVAVIKVGAATETEMKKSTC